MHRGAHHSKWTNDLVHRSKVALGVRLHHEVDVIPSGLVTWIGPRLEMWASRLHEELCSPLTKMEGSMHSQY
jgi:hypothetical protein